MTSTANEKENTVTGDANQINSDQKDQFRDIQEPEIVMQELQKPEYVTENKIDQGIDIASTGHNGPHVALRIADKVDVAVLLDTGADCQGIISAGILKKHGINHSVTPTTTKIKGVGGKNMGVIGKTCLETKINGLSKTIKFILVEEDGFCLVGLPTLKSYKIQINTSEETIICNDLMTNYFKKEGIMGKEVKVNLIKKEECNIHLDSTVTIPANMSMLVFAKLNGMDMVEKGKLLEVDGSYAATRYGIIIPRGVVSKDDKIPILIKKLVQQ